MTIEEAEAKNLIYVKAEKTLTGEVYWLMETLTERRIFALTTNVFEEKISEIVFTPEGRVLGVFF